MNTHHNDAPAERSKEMLLKHPPLFLRTCEDGTLNHTLPTLPGFNLEEVEMLLFTALGGKMLEAGLSVDKLKTSMTAIMAGNRAVDNHGVKAASLSDDEAMALFSWAVSARAQAIVGELLTEQYETEYARRFLNQCSDAGFHKLVEEIHNTVRDTRKKSEGWSQDERMRDAATFCLEGVILQLVLEGDVLPHIKEGEENTFTSMRGGTGTLDKIEADEEVR